jgi:hypothetical protein
VTQRFVPGESQAVIEMNMEVYNRSAAHIKYVRDVHATAFRRQLITFWLCFIKVYPDADGQLADVMPTIAKKLWEQLPKVPDT